MRISTPLIYEQGISALSAQQTTLLRAQAQISSGKRILTPADDPVAAGQALVTRQSQAENTQFAANIGAAKDALSLNETVLAQITDLLQSVRTTAVNAGNTILTDADRRALAADVQSQLTQLLGLANSSDSSGGYLFGGFQNTTAPFSQAGTLVRFQGDQGTRVLQVGPTRTLDVSVNGSALFEQISNASGAFAASAAPANTGSAVLTAGAVSNPAAVDDHTYRLQFNVSGGLTTYDVIDATTNTAVAAQTGVAYTPGSTITVAGRDVTVTGAPGNGDGYTLAPRTLFSTLQGLVDTLQSTGGNGVGNARIGAGVTDALKFIDVALDHVLATRADGGAKLRELDALDDGATARGLQFDQTLSRLEDLDYARALSMFSQQQVALEAAQKSFIKTTGLSLFNYL